jgi:tetratricopeptide (TPR) repeat protein
VFSVVGNKYIGNFDIRYSVRARIRRQLITGVYLLLTMLHAHADADAQSQQRFDQALNAYKIGDYSQAIEGFNAAIASGMDAPAVYYNLAVCYYRIGDYDQAEQNFLKTARFPAMQAVAYYNLGLVSLKKQNKQSALTWLKKSQLTSTDEKLDYLVSKELSKIQGTDAKSPRTGAASGSKWSSVLVTGIGYDDNVSLDNSELVLVSQQSATVANLFASTQGVLSGTQNHGSLFKGSFYADMNNGRSELNLAEIEGGLYLADKVDGWQNEYGLNLSHSTLGGAAYLDKAGISVSTLTSWSKTLGLDLRLRLREIRSRDVLYDPLEGVSQDVRVIGRWKPDTFQYFKLSYQLYNNDRNDFRTATRFSSFSDTRHRLSAEYRYIPTPRYGLRLAGEYRLSNYKDDNIEANGDAIRRRDERFKLLLGLGYNWSREILLGVKYEYVNNESNIERFEYISSRVLASWSVFY